MKSSTSYYVAPEVHDPWDRLPLLLRNVVEPFLTAYVFDKVLSTLGNPDEFELTDEQVDSLNEAREVYFNSIAEQLCDRFNIPTYEAFPVGTLELAHETVYDPKLRFADFSSVVQAEANLVLDVCKRLSRTAQVTLQGLDIMEDIPLQYDVWSEHMPPPQTKGPKIKKGWPEGVGGPS